MISKTVRHVILLKQTQLNSETGCYFTLPQLEAITRSTQRIRTLNSLIAHGQVLVEHAPPAPSDLWRGYVQFAFSSRLLTAFPIEASKFIINCALLDTDPMIRSFLRVAYKHSGLCPLSFMHHIKDLEQRPQLKRILLKEMAEG